MRVPKDWWRPWARRFRTPRSQVTLLVPWGREDVTARLYREAEVLGTEADGEGTIVRALVGERELAAVREFVRP